MNKEINLLSQNKKQAQERSVRILQYIAGVVSTLTLGALVTIFFLKLTSPLQALRAQESASLATMTVLAPKAAKLVFIKDRLKDADVVVATRPAFDQTIDYLTSKLSDEVTIDTLKITTSSILFRARSQSLASIHGFLNYIVDAGGKKPAIKQIILTDLIYDGKAASYYFTLTIPHS